LPALRDVDVSRLRGGDAAASEVNTELAAELAEEEAELAEEERAS
jgi:hypothetical protein